MRTRNPIGNNVFRDGKSSRTTMKFHTGFHGANYLRSLFICRWLHRDASVMKDGQRDKELLELIPKQEGDTFQLLQTCQQERVAEMLTSLRATTKITMT